MVDKINHLVSIPKIIQEYLPRMKAPILSEGEILSADRLKIWWDLYQDPGTLTPLKIPTRRQKPVWGS